MGPRFQLEQNELPVKRWDMDEPSRSLEGILYNFFGTQIEEKQQKSYQNPSKNPGDFSILLVCQPKIHPNPLNPPCSRSPRSVEFESPTHSVAAPQQRHVETGESVGDSTENS